MEVRGQSQPSAAQRFAEARAEVASANREKIRQAQESMADLARSSGERRSRETDRDRVELSAQAARASRSEALRAEQVQELRAAHESGTLATPERVEKAAQRILGG